MANTSRRRSCRVAAANAPGCDFPIENLPYGVFSIGDAARVGVAIGDRILDLAKLEAGGVLRPSRQKAIFSDDSVNAFMALGPSTWAATRAAIQSLLTADHSLSAEEGRLVDDSLVPMGEARLHLPFTVSGFTDFYSSREHATNVGRMFRSGEEPLTPNWLHMPIAYNGRASTVVVSGTPVRRPLGQVRRADAALPQLTPSRRLDYELELGTIVGTPSLMGNPISVAEAYDMIFGYVLLNDWSARDIQLWEYRPLGPFQSKAFATTISPWIVTAEALANFRVAPPRRQIPLLPYLAEREPYNYDLHLAVSVKARHAAKATLVSTTNHRFLYYTPPQQLAHHAISGCAMQTGDLLGSGTISGPTADSVGSLLEASQGGTRPIVLHGGETRGFLEDGDTVTFTGWCEADGYRLGFGSCSGTILPAPAIG